MKARSGWKPWLAGGLAAAVLVAVVIAALVVFRPRPGPPDGRGGGLRVDPETYREMVSAFFAGVAALDADAADRARASLSRAVELVPGEPAAWANRGLLEIRVNNYEAASRDLERARDLAPQDASIERLLGLLESRRGQSEEAVAHLRKAAALDPEDARTLYSLSREVERLGGEGGVDEARDLLQRILDRQPENLTVLVERARLAAKAGDAEGLRDAVARLSGLSASWPPRTREALGALEQAAAGASPRAAAVQIVLLRNLLLTDPSFRRSIDAVETPYGVVGEPFERFLKLPNPEPTPSPPDEALAFAVEPLPGAGPSPWGTVAVVAMTGGDDPPALFAASGVAVGRMDRDGPALPFPGGPAGSPPTPDGLLAVDWDSDYRMDLVLAGAGGVRLFRQGDDGTFSELAEPAALPPDVRAAPASGAWAADIDSDGDLDLVVGAAEGPPAVLRNSGNNTFDAVYPFEGASDLRGFVWADLDQDGLPDAGLLDRRGTLRVFTNERSGRFRERPMPEGLGAVAALTVADLDSDGIVDLIALRDDGTILRASDEGEGAGWRLAEVLRLPEPPRGEARLLVADLDNNGALDLIASTPGRSRAWLGGVDGFRPIATPDAFRVLDVADLSGDGRLDLAGLADAGLPARATGRGAKDYHWQVIRPRAARNAGDSRINSFGIGGEVEVRAGLLVQKQVIAGPTLHFGLGDHVGVDVARVVWPNGTVLAEFDTRPDQALVAEQRLKGSCPFVFADDGTGIRFVTDFLWRSPLGLRINAQDTAGAGQTEDWIKIRGDQLAAREGYYDVRITAELWETHYFDHMSLMVVDHPAGTEVFVDERFARDPPALAVHATGPLRPFASARDDSGRDVAEIVREPDGRYLDTFGRGQYQGVTRDHWVELELGDDLPHDRPLRLVARGWIHPTDSSINVALSQGRQAPPRGLALEVPTVAGEWVAARADLGFPAGKDKTILIDLDGVFREGAPRRLRLRTNLEIFWDSLSVAAAEAGARLEMQRLAPASAELRFRGYSLMTQADAGSPELPHYENVTGTGQRWRDLAGFYTRFGDISELLAATDDRYAIVNAGDEVALRFPAPPPPAPGLVRDFVLVGDGWNKDGDFNTAFSGTVLPLPSHDRPAYDTPPGELADDPVYRAHPGDWVEYHTRSITPQGFRRGLRPASRP